jgi:hypothetical protein
MRLTQVTMFFTLDSKLGGNHPGFPCAVKKTWFAVTSFAVATIATNGAT